MIFMRNKLSLPQGPVGLLEFSQVAYDERLQAVQGFAMGGGFDILDVREFLHRRVFAVNVLTADNCVVCNGSFRRHDCIVEDFAILNYL